MRIHPKVLFLLTAVLLGGYASSASAPPQIVVPATPTPVETRAAGELRHYLGLTTGCEPEIVAEAAAGPAFYIGRAAPGGLPELEADEIMLESIPGGSIVLAGGETHGTLYAVYEFLEKYYGVRWWTSTETTTPQAEALVIPADAHIRFVPPILIRECFYDDVINHPEFASHTRNNGHHNRLPEELGGHFEIIGFVHTFEQMVPPSVYFEAHPEWFSEIDGKRSNEQGVQLCLSNPEVVGVLTEKTLERLRKHPDPRVISVSQNDFYKQCQCADCLAVDAEEGSPAGVLLRAVNQVAEAVEKEFPGVRVETLAYQHTLPPPKITRPRHNVMIRICTIRLGFTETMENSESNAPIKASLDGWAEIAPEVAVWNYVTNYWNFLLPHPILRHLDDHTRYFVKSKAKSVFQQGHTNSGGMIGDFAPLRAWVTSKLLWDPELDGETLVDEFLLGYYGPEIGPVLKEYLWLLEDEVAKIDYRFGCYHMTSDQWLTAPTLLRARGLMRQARDLAAGDPVLADRVDLAAIGIDLVTMEHYPKLLEAGATDLPDPDALVDDLAMRLEKYGLIKFGEDWFGPFIGHGNRSDLVEKLRTQAEAAKQAMESTQ